MLVVRSPFFPRVEAGKQRRKGSLLWKRLDSGGLDDAFLCSAAVKGNTCVLVALLISWAAEYPSGQMLWTNVKQTLSLRSWSGPEKVLGVSPCGEQASITRDECFAGHS